MTHPAKITFPCGGEYTLGEMISEYRLASVGGMRWGAGIPNVARLPDEEFLRLVYGDGALDIVFLRHLPADAIHAGGTWTNGEGVAFVLSKGDNGGVILRGYSATGPRGPNWIEGVDG